MKGLKQHFIAYLLIGIAISFTACKDDRPELEAPGSKLEGINSGWEMVGATVIDIASIQQKTLDVSTAFIGSQAMKIDFDTTGFAYTVEKGFGPNYFGDSGTWAFDNNENPTLITLTTNEGKTIVLTLSRTIRPVDPNLIFTFNRTIEGQTDPYIAYEFTFARTQ